MHIQFGEQYCFQAPSLEGLDACVKAYADGFASGRDWPVEWNYIPGGPWVYSGDNAELRKRHKDAHAAWMRGFHNGILNNDKIPLGHGARY